jgi:hypothetical protein
MLGYGKPDLVYFRHGYCTKQGIIGVVTDERDPYEVAANIFFRCVIVDHISTPVGAGNDA